MMIEKGLISCFLSSEENSKYLISREFIHTREACILIKQKNLSNAFYHLPFGPSMTSHPKQSLAKIAVPLFPKYIPHFLMERGYFGFSGVHFGYVHKVTSKIAPNSFQNRPLGGRLFRIKWGATLDGKSVRVQMVSSWRK